MLVVFACILGLPAWGLWVLFRHRHRKARLGERLYELLLDAETASGEEADLLLARACQECERIHRKKPRYAYALYAWGASLILQSQKADLAEAARLYESADEKLILALRYAVDEGRFRDYPENPPPLYPDGTPLRRDVWSFDQGLGRPPIRKGRLGRGGMKSADLFRPHWYLTWGPCRSIGEDAQRLTEPGDERLAAALAMPPDTEARIIRKATLQLRASLLNAWGARLIEQAGGAGFEDAGCLYQSAVEKLTSALAIAPSSTAARFNRNAALLAHAGVAPGEAGRSYLERVCQECEERLGENPREARSYIDWGCALCSQAVRVPRAKAEQCYATAEEKFACALNIAQEDETALVWLGLTLARRAGLHSGEERVHLLDRATVLFDDLLRRQPLSLPATEGRAFCLLCRARYIAGDETERRLAEAMHQLDEIAPADAGAAGILEAKGDILWAQALCHSSERRLELLRAARQAFTDAESLLHGSCAYSLACVHALLGDAGECQRWLDVSREPGLRVSRDEMATEPNLESVWECRWFRTMLGEVTAV